MGGRKGSSRNPGVDPLNRKLLSPNTLLSPASLLSLKSVSLLDWWLVQAQGNGIAVEGFACRELGARLFRSAPILNRRDSTTLETTDGITITVAGTMNRLRTLQSGFPVSVCNRFLLGFPYDWEGHAPSPGGKSSTSATNDGGKTLFPASFDQLTTTKLRDIVMCIPEGSETHFWDMVVEEHKDDEEVEHFPSTADCPNQTNQPAAEAMGCEGFVIGGVVTRSMQRRRKLQEAENVITSEGATPVKRKGKPRKKHLSKGCEMEEGDAVEAGFKQQTPVTTATPGEEELNKEGTATTVRRSGRIKSLEGCSVLKVKELSTSNK